MQFLNETVSEVERKYREPGSRVLDEAPCA